MEVNVDQVPLEELMNWLPLTPRPRYPADADPQPAADPPGHDLSALADMIVRRLFDVGLALQSACALADGPVEARLQQVLNQLDSVIQDTRTTVFESRELPHHRIIRAS